MPVMCQMLCGEFYMHCLMKFTSGLVDATVLKIRTRTLTLSFVHFTVYQEKQRSSPFH